MSDEIQVELVRGCKAIIRLPDGHPPVTTMVMSTRSHGSNAIEEVRVTFGYPDDGVVAAWVDDEDEEPVVVTELPSEQPGVREWVTGAVDYGTGAT